MHVALLTYSFLPKRAGLEFAVHYLAESLVAAGHHVTVFAPVGGGVDPKIEHHYRLVHFRNAGGWLGWLRREAAPLIGQFKRVHREKPIDVINVHSAYLAASGAREVSRRFGVPYVVTCQGEDVQKCPAVGYGYRLDPGRDRLITENLSSAARVVAISPSIHKDIAEMVPEECIVPIPNGVDIERFHPVLPGGVNEAPPCPEDGPVILSVGRHVPKKRFSYALSVFARLAALHPTVHYVHAGRDGESLRDEAVRLGIAERFTALGDLNSSRLSAVYRAATVYLSPSVIEGFSLSNLEAMASGLPCIVTDAPGNRDSVDDGENGWIVPLDDMEAMCDKIRNLLDDENQRATFGARSRRIVESKYAWPIVAEQYADVLKDVIGRPA